MATDLNKVKEIFAFLLAQAFARNAPKDTGKLSKAFPGTVRVLGDKIRFTLPEYAKHVIRGTAPHEILPNKKKALKFKANGKKVFTKKVMHPGTAPNFFLQDTVNREFGDLLKKAFRIANRG